MNGKLILTLSLAILLLAGYSTISSAGPVSEDEPQVQAPPPPDVEAPDAEDGDSPEWRCPKCGANCPFPEGRRMRRGGARGAGMRAPRAGRQGQFGRGQRGMGLASAGILRHASRLDLTEDQISQLEKLAYDAKSQMIDLESDLKKARLELRRQMDGDSGDVSAMNKQIDAIGQQQASIQKLKLKNWIDARKVLTDEQKKLVGKGQYRMGMRL